MSKPLFVKASNGLKVPYENRANRYITDTIVEVPNTLYYRRRISDGDLIEMPTTKTIRKPATKTEKGDQ